MANGFWGRSSFGNGFTDAMKRWAEAAENSLIFFILVDMSANWVEWERGVEGLRRVIVSG